MTTLKIETKFNLEDECFYYRKEKDTYTIEKVEIEEIDIKTNKDGAYFSEQTTIRYKLDNGNATSEDYLYTKEELIDTVNRDITNQLEDICD